jgi:hypothetical protein
MAETTEGEVVLAIDRGNQHSWSDRFSFIWLTAMGTLTRQRTFRNDGATRLTDVAVVGDSGFVALGSVIAQEGLQTGGYVADNARLVELFRKGTTNLFLGEYDRDGRIVRQTKLHHAYSTDSSRVLATKDGGLLIAATRIGQMSDGIVSGKPLIARLDMSRQVEWAKSIGTEQDLSLHDVVLTADGVTTVLGGIKNKEAHGSIPFLASIGRNGGLLWSKRLLNTADLRAMSLDGGGIVASGVDRDRSEEWVFDKVVFDRVGHVGKAVRCVVVLPSFIRDCREVRGLGSDHFFVRSACNAVDSSVVTLVRDDDDGTRKRCSTIVLTSADFEVSLVDEKLEQSEARTEEVQDTIEFSPHGFLRHDELR